MIHPVSIRSGDIPLRSPCADTESLTGAPSSNDRRSLKERVAEIWDRFVHALRNLFNIHEGAPVGAAASAGIADVKEPEEEPVEPAASAGIAEVEVPEKEAPLEPADLATIEIENVAEEVKKAKNTTIAIMDKARAVDTEIRQLTAPFIVATALLEETVKSMSPQEREEFQAQKKRLIELSREVDSLGTPFMTNQRKRMGIDHIDDWDSLLTIDYAIRRETSLATEGLKEVKTSFKNNRFLDPETLRGLHEVKTRAQTVASMAIRAAIMEQNIREKTTEMKSIMEKMTKTRISMIATVYLS